MARRRLLNRIRARLTRFQVDGNPDVVLSAAATAEITELLSLVADPVADPDVSSAVGMLYWCRYRALPAGTGEQDLDSALALLAPVYGADPQGPLNDSAALDAAIDLLRQAIAAPARDASRGAYLARLGYSLRCRFELAGAMSDLDDAVAASRQAIAATAADDPGRAERLDSLATALSARFRHAGASADLDEAITAGRAAVEAVSPDLPEYATYLDDLGIDLFTRFAERTESTADLDEAVAAGRRALAVTAPADPDYARRLNILGNALSSRAEYARPEYGRPAEQTPPEQRPAEQRPEEDLDEAVTLLRQAVAITPETDPDRAMYLSNLAGALRTLFAGTHALADADEAIRFARESVAVTPADHPDHAMYLANLAGILLRRFERSGSPGDLDEAIATGQRSVAATAADDGDYPARLSILGTALSARSEYYAASSDFDQAVALLRTAVAASPADLPDRAMYRSNLGMTLLQRFERGGHLPDLDEAVDSCREAVASTPADSPERPGRLSNLAGALLKRFEHSGDLAYLEQAIDVCRQAVLSCTAQHPDRLLSLANLGVALLSRYERTGAAENLDEAILVDRQAVEGTPAGHPDRAGRWSNLGTALSARFDDYGALGDLDEAIDAGRQAVEETPAGDPDKAGRLSNLSTALAVRFARSGELNDLNEAIETGRRAVAAAPAGHVNRAAILANLSLPLRTRFEQLGNPADLAEAIECSRQAIACTATGHPDRAKYLSSLSTALCDRFEQSGTPADLDEAVSAGRSAADGTPVDAPEYAGRLFDLGVVVLARHSRTGDPAGLREAAGLFENASKVRAAPARVRVRAARRWGGLAAASGNWAQAAEGYAAAVRLLAQAAPRAIERHDQEFALRQLAGIGNDAAACSIQAGDYSRAAEFWEQGHGVLLGQALDTRTDLTVLAEQRPALAARFRAVRDALEAASATDSTVPALVSVRESRGHGTVARGEGEGERGRIDRRRKLADEFDRVVSEVRARPGFERFLLPADAGELLPAAAEGPVVLLNPSDIRSDAIVLTAQGVDVVPLPSLTPDGARAQVEDFLVALAGSDEPALGKVLAWLWEAVTGPVLDHLEIDGRPKDGESWPRLWWCPSGLLSFLPLHAAGHHGTRFDRVPHTVIDRAVSSYTPTVRALLRARRQQDAGAAGPAPSPRVLVVAMPKTPGAADLRGAEAEARLLRRLYGDQVTVCEGPAVTHDTVLGLLPRFPWAHFTCHGLSSLDEPSASHLLLEDHHRRPLTVTDIARLRLDHAELAYLSACSTARTGVALADEAIHLASAFQLAGYRHVIGTLWEVGDRPAARVATDVYTAIAASAASAAGAGLAARALHDATRALRTRLPDHPSAWASHVHVGP